MRYWWVNHNQTYRQEVRGNYLWSPKRKANRDRNPFYESMREVAPGDLVFSFAGGQIAAVGRATSYAAEAPKPPEFGETGRNWDDIGWRVEVRFQRLAVPFRPAEWMELLGPLLPTRYAPLQRNGRGLQGIYLTELPVPLALQIADLAGSEIGAWARSEEVADLQMSSSQFELVLWEEHLREEIEGDENIPKSEREALVVARRGQGRFRTEVLSLEHYCRVTRVDRPEHLRASHCKPWRDSTNAERLDGHNGLLLTPSIDHLFDRGFISFENGGDLILSPVAHLPSLARMGVPTEIPLNVGSFTKRQQGYLEFHRDAVFLKRQLGGA